MTSKTITIAWNDVFYDARANTWKTGAVAPREDGLHGEGQMDDDGVDVNLAKRSYIDALHKLLESVKRFSTGSNLPATMSGVTGSATITLSVSSRNNSTDNELSALGHAFVVAHICADWYKMLSSNLEKDWLDKMQEAEARLKSALYKKIPPTLVETNSGGNSGGNSGNSGNNDSSNDNP